ncbi:MAG: Cupredoxin-like domain [Pseudonocardiales bacterium]|nr:Cupredoxin-like domain [Pseudonocardiales bacterium]
MSETSWRAVLRRSAIAGVVVSVLIVAIVEKGPDPPAVISAVLLLVAAILLRRDGRGSARYTTVVFVLFLLTNLAFRGPNLAVAESFWSFAVSWASVLAGLVGVIAGVATWRRRPPSAVAASVGVTGLGLSVVAVVIGLFASFGYTNAKPAAGDIAVRAKDSTFDHTTLTAPSGRVGFFLDNADNALHDLHIVGVKGGTKTMPAHHKARFVVTLPAGAYKFMCDYHSDMKGTLTVR